MRDTIVEILEENKTVTTLIIKDHVDASDSVNYHRL
jgi:hypothetical protein